MNQDNYYVKPAEFRKVLQEYQETRSKSSYEKLGKMFLAICYNLTNHNKFRKFVNYSANPDLRKDDLVGEATPILLDKIDNFDFSRGTDPFSYFTEAAKNAFKFHMGNQAKQDELISVSDFTENMSGVGD